jgi:hypothetical protein
MTPDKRSSTFRTRGLIFYHFIKLREDDDGTILDLWIDELHGGLNSNMVTSYIDHEVLPQLYSTPEIFGRYDVTENNDPFQ